MTDRLRTVAIAISVVGIAIAGYLTYVHYAGISPVCEIAHGCEKVQTSEWSKVAGIPVAVLGLLGYVGILAALLIPGETAATAAAGMALIGVGFSAYLTYREMAEQLVPYVADMGFTHMEVLPVTEYPFDLSLIHI